MRSAICVAVLRRRATVAQDGQFDRSRGGGHSTARRGTSQTTDANVGVLDGYLSKHEVRGNDIVAHVVAEDVLDLVAGKEQLLLIDQSFGKFSRCPKSLSVAQFPVSGMRERISKVGNSTLPASVAK